MPQFLASTTLDTPGVSPLALLAATCSKIGPATAAVDLDGPSKDAPVENGAVGSSETESQCQTESQCGTSEVSAAPHPTSLMVSPTTSSSMPSLISATLPMSGCQFLSTSGTVPTHVIVPLSYPLSTNVVPSPVPQVLTSPETSVNSTAQDSVSNTCAKTFASVVSPPIGTSKETPANDLSSFSQIKHLPTSSTNPKNLQSSLAQEKYNIVDDSTMTATSYGLTITEVGTKVKGFTSTSARIPTYHPIAPKPPKVLMSTPSSVKVSPTQSQGIETISTSLSVTTGTTVSSTAGITPATKQNMPGTIEINGQLYCRLGPAKSSQDQAVALSSSVKFVSSDSSVPQPAFGSVSDPTSVAMTSVPLSALKSPIPGWTVVGTIPCPAGDIPSGSSRCFGKPPPELQRSVEAAALTPSALQLQNGVVTVVPLDTGGELRGRIVSINEETSDLEASVVKALKQVNGSKATLAGVRGGVAISGLAGGQPAPTQPYVINQHHGVRQAIVIDPSSIPKLLQGGASQPTAPKAALGSALASLNWQVKKQRRVACTCPNCKKGERDGGKRIHICHIPGCGKTYGKTSHLRAHLRGHLGDKPFVCNWLFCKASFSRSDELLRHKRTHGGERQYECVECRKRFIRSDHLSKHIKTHLQDTKSKSQKKSGSAYRMANSRKKLDDPDEVSSSNQVSDAGLVQGQLMSVEATPSGYVVQGPWQGEPRAGTSGVNTGPRPVPNNIIIEETEDDDDEVFMPDRSDRTVDREALAL